MEQEVRDLQGNVLNVGDKVVYTDSTYSKTPLLNIGTITEIKHFFNKNGTWKETLIRVKLEVTSDHAFVKTLQEENYKHRFWNDWKKTFYDNGAEFYDSYWLNPKKYVSILKIS